MAKSKGKVLGPDLQPLSRERTWVDFLHPESLMAFPHKDSWKERLKLTMLLWSEEPESIEILQFYREYKISRSSMYEILKRHPDVKEAFENMKLNIACNRRVGTIKRKLDGTFAYKDMHRYDAEWGPEVNEYHAKLNKDQEEKAQVINVNMIQPQKK